MKTLHYITKEGKSFIRIWETEKPTIERFCTDETNNYLQNEWIKSYTDYEIKAEFVDEIETELKQFDFDFHKGIRLPPEIAERVEMESTCNRCPYEGMHHRECLKNCSTALLNKRAILKPVVKESFTSESNEEMIIDIFESITTNYRKGIKYCNDKYLVTRKPNN